MYKTFYTNPSCPSQTLKVFPLELSGPRAKPKINFRSYIAAISYIDVLYLATKPKHK